MAWPLSQDYNEAIQTPAQCFSDPELRQGEAVCNAMGLPIPCSGNFADVYAVQAGQQKWAVKCFTRQIQGLRERYAEISKYLAQVRLPFMVQFTFLEQGIRVRGQWYPILKMQWVEGQTLNGFVKSQLDNPAILRTASQLWARMGTVLREANLAHGDLQHGNVLLVPGSKAGTVGIKLVDYDGMCVPALELLKATEVGHPAYQHPQRLREGTYGLHIDRFSHLVIYTALRALMIGGRKLWERFDNGDNLLFSQKDFENPQASALFQELLRLNDPEVKKLVQAVASAGQKPVEQAPLLGELVPAESVKAGDSATKLSASGAATGTQVAPRRTGVSIAKSATEKARKGANWSAASASESSQVRRRQRKSNLGLVLGILGSLVIVVAISAFMLFGGGTNEDDRAKAAPGTKASRSSPTTPKAAIPSTKTHSPSATTGSKTAPKAVDKIPALVIECGRGLTDATQEEKISPGYGYTLINGGFHDGGGWHCWHAGDSLRFEIAVPPGIGGNLVLLCLDGDGVRNQRITVQGSEAEKGLAPPLGLITVENFVRPGKRLTFSISEESTATGKLSVVVDNLAGKANAVVSTVEFYPTMPYTPPKSPANSSPPQYLIDLKESNYKVGQPGWAFGKGNVGNGPGIMEVAGKKYPRGLGMVPSARGYAGVTYTIKKEMDMFVSRVAFADGSGPRGPVSWEVWGDGKILWSSQAIQGVKYFQGCAVSVKEVSVLELRTVAHGDNFGCYSVWLDPYFVKDGEARRTALPDPQPPMNLCVGVWEHFVLGRSLGRITLLADGHINDPNGSSTWMLNGSTLVLRWPSPQAPGGAFVDTCTVSPDRNSYLGRNNKNEQISGRKVQ